MNLENIFINILLTIQTLSYTHFLQNISAQVTRSGEFPVFSIYAPLEHICCCRRSFEYLLQICKNQSRGEKSYELTSELLSQALTLVG